MYNAEQCKDSRNEKRMWEGMHHRRPITNVRSSSAISGALPCNRQAALALAVLVDDALEPVAAAVRLVLSRELEPVLEGVTVGVREVMELGATGVPMVLTLVEEADGATFVSDDGTGLLEVREATGEEKEPDMPVRLYVGSVWLWRAVGRRT